jgi:hypothetical protein
MGTNEVKEPLAFMRDVESEPCRERRRTVSVSRLSNMTMSHHASG